MSEDKPPFLIISTHDYRSSRKASMHFIAEELAKKGKTRFFSVGFSHLSRIIKDHRLPLWGRANRVETQNNIDAYLWQTFVHPVKLPKDRASILLSIYYYIYARLSPRIFKSWVKESKTIFIESSISLAFFGYVKKLNPDASVIYIASDSLRTNNEPRALQKILAKAATKFDRVKISSLLMASEFPRGTPLIFVPQGVKPSIKDPLPPSPYRPGVNLVSIGAMLFDRSFFEIAAKAFPEITFHVIGGGKYASLLSVPNIVVYPDKPYDETIAYIAHANAGIAPYNGQHVSPYLADTSLKLLQYGYYGIPAICPQTVCGKYTGRFGYISGDKESITSAIRQALACQKIPATSILTWEQIANRILDPAAYPDTHIDAKRV
ncbi:MAG: hypothetical protein PHE27_06850 [Alphaproteobacteria bacterium]|nr:hypothetical protein [Alphaproteobacteria bacterium]